MSLKENGIRWLVTCYKLALSAGSLSKSPLSRIPMKAPSLGSVVIKLTMKFFNNGIVMS
jgi:hypothetical protein